jgi:hypothetical protein
MLQEYTSLHRSAPLGDEGRRRLPNRLLYADPSPECEIPVTDERRVRLDRIANEEGEAFVPTDPAENLSPIVPGEGPEGVVR